MPRRIIIENCPYWSIDKATLHCVNGCSINACRESRIESLRHKATAVGSADKRTFDPSGDILCLYYGDVGTMSLSDAFHIQRLGRPFHFYNGVFDIDARKEIERVEIIVRDAISAGPSSEYEAFPQVLLPFLRRFPVMREVTVGKLRSDRLSVKTGVWEKTTSFEKYSVMRKPTLRKVQTKVEEAFEKEKLLRPEWKALSVRFIQQL
ncbi:uncharacterized protein PAC_14124 [Phialocephala subalpina]|uniref:Uncharacterized protein n=1 Tax=Phialocephala subalpina TaxID=576137 RepID=A0A1L7XGY2_9HELO|nr:uncharacterized protein PAC_14124 [Phialocephala subalpina]